MSPAGRPLLARGFLDGVGAQAVVAPLAEPGAYAATALAPDAATLRRLLRRAEAVCFADASQ
jgi:hypothetical protein